MFPVTRNQELTVVHTKLFETIQRIPSHKVLIVILEPELWTSLSKLLSTKSGLESWI